MADKKLILDATAGYRMMWFNKHHPNAIYLDARPECEPDIVGDFRKLNFPDETFKLIIWDPPHIIENAQLGNSNMKRDYGFLRPETWQRDLKRGFEELWRVLKVEGVLLFKWSNQYVSADRILKLFPEKPLIYQISANNPKRGKTGGVIKHVQTLWFCFMKLKKEKPKNPQVQPQLSIFLQEAST
ncbi:methyltransferase [Candidatus Bathyarchaeota archaeon A05DMB-2]|jgi:hypothetical protein|nr:methyltransferase [Candidatus Bathyarchaeota archaeon A05DMB-2]